MTGLQKLTAGICCLKMDVFTFALSVVIAFLGLLAGCVLAKYSHDEVHQFRKSIHTAQLLVLVLLFVLFFVYFPFWVALAILVLSFSFILLFWHRKDMNLLDYVVLGVLFGLTSVDAQLHLYMTLLVFLFGLFTGSLHYVLHTKHHNHPVKKVGIHNHSGKHFSFNMLTEKLFQDYYFFVILTFCSWAAGELIRLTFF